jgi:hypothetical protein
MDHGLGAWSSGQAARADHFGEVYLLVTPLPPPPWSIGIIDLEEIRDLIYGLQLLKGKILSRKEFSLRSNPDGQCKYRGREFLSQGWMNIARESLCGKREVQ